MQRVLAALFLLSIHFHCIAQVLSGSVTDRISGDKLPGASIYLPDLKKGTTTDPDGNFKLYGLPSGTFLVQVKLIGYTSTTRLIDLSQIRTATFELDPRSIEQQEVVITGSAFTSDKSRTSVAVESLDRQQLQSSGAPNLMQAISQLPGVSTLSTGAGIAKPVIRGLGLTRVLVIDKGIRQEGQQWGEEHGPEIDQFAADHIEVLKGPSSLQFGSDALGGVINIAEPLTPAPGAIKAQLNSTYSTNNRMYGNSIMATANHRGLIWRIRGSMKSAASFSTPVEKVYNTCFHENAGEVMLGLNKPWGYSHLNMSNYSAVPGLTEGERDSITGRFLDQSGAIVSESQLDSRTAATPFQHINHFKVSSNSNFIISGHQLKVTAGYQKNIRQEFEMNPAVPDKNMHLNTLTGDVIFHPSIQRDWESAVGISGMLQDNRNHGTSYIIPDFNSSGYGIFSSVKKNRTYSTFSAGIRFDAKAMEWSTLIAAGDTVFTGRRRSFSALTGAIGYTHAFNGNWSVKVNLGRGYRAPSAPELTSNGIHEGTFRYEIGNPELDPETSLQFDLGTTYALKLFSFSLAAFMNRIDNYIFYSQRNNETRMVDQQNYPVYRYIQGNAFLYGGEMTIDIHPAEPLHVENSIAIVVGENTSTRTPLPFMPPFKTTHELRYDFDLTHWKSPTTFYITFGMNVVFNQNRIDTDFETPTGGYSVLRSSAGCSIKMNGRSVDLYFVAENLSNTRYYDHLSRYKQIGVYGMGRNFTFGIQLPLDINQRKN